jgi:hypothetical protein
MDTSTAALEASVTERWAKLAAERAPEWPLPDFGGVDGLGDMMAEWSAVTPPAPQFPREQWVSHPTKRALALLLADRLMDCDTLTDGQWMTVCRLVLYGGKGTDIVMDMSTEPGDIRDHPHFQAWKQVSESAIKASGGNPSETRIVWRNPAIRKPSTDETGEYRTTNLDDPPSEEPDDGHEHRAGVA